MEIRKSPKCDNDFIGLCKDAIYGYYMGEVNKQQIQIVWFNYTLRNYKALFMAKHTDNLYFECTWNSDKKELYTDIYEKQHKLTIPLD